MKKILLLILVIPFLSNCSQYSAMIGPSYTLIETGSVLQASTSLSRSLVMNNAKESIVDDINNDTCPVVHSAELNKIFFETLEHMDCFNDPMSIYR